MGNSTHKPKVVHFHLIAKALLHTPQMVFLLFVKTIVAAVLPFLSIFSIKLIVEELSGRRDLRTLVIYVASYCVAAFVFNYIIAMCQQLCEKYGDSYNRYFNRLICKKVMNMPYFNLEDPDILNKMQKAKSGIEDSSGGVQAYMVNICGIISDIVSALGVIAIIFYYAPPLLIVCLISAFLRAVIIHKINEINVDAQRNISVIQRKFLYYFTHLTTQKYAKDLKMYNGNQLIMDKVSNYENECIEKGMKVQAENRKNKVLFSDAFKSLSQIFGFFYLGILLINKVISYGDFTMLITSALTLDTSINGCIEKVMQSRAQRNFLKDYINFMELPSLESDGKREHIISDKHTIQFKNVTFKYPRSKVYALKNVSLLIKPGERVAIVGRNGAGKTTLCKLLCRMYEPESGNILIDGIDIRYYSVEECYKLFSVVFQDFMLFAYSIAENIATKHDISEDEYSRIAEVSEIVGLDKKFEKLPEGVSTTIYKIFDEHGIEPSGGEAQKIAIARALYKDAPIIILDEPTAALDPIAENEIYSNFNSLIGDKTAIYVSHRLSSTRFADRILVFRNGEICESGNHDSLISLGGEYADMFSHQAQFYN
ncbi:MAG: ABC transporter ATP-binding protein/permease [Oscillospiraceae bacterium]|jgi:ABC-type multidrug transport system fused ATPase/permease subunit|nr:ABC transporter ATP-binding protein/permease [Oscillospiraceae bacterium]